MSSVRVASVPEDLAAAVREFRQRHGLSASAFGRLLPADRVSVYRWESGARTPPPYLIRALRDLERELSENI
jgi:DNA-binding transcriptional regulator YiaG